MDQTITQVILWTNGQVMVFDQAGEQMTNFQGYYGQVKVRICALFDGDWSLCEFERGQLATFNPARVSPLGELLPPLPS